LQDLQQNDVFGIRLPAAIQ